MPKFYFEEEIKARRANKQPESIQMPRYRIIEKKGKYKTVTSSESVEGISYGDYNVVDVHREVYIPRYIVQEDIGKYSRRGYVEAFKDLREFTDLDEARRFKNDLELDEGRVVE